MADRPAFRCPATHRADAVRLLAAARDPAQRNGLAQCVDAANQGDAGAWDGLFVAGAPPTAALWVQRAPGNAAVVWPPPSDEPAADALFAAAADFVDAAGIGVAQMIVSDDDGFDAESMRRRGFGRLAELAYLYAELPDAAPPPAKLPQSTQLSSDASKEPQRLAAVIERTYVESQDCPALDGVRSMAEVLEGYRVQGVHRPEHWYFVVESGRDVGVLLLADHPSVGNWELVYMGLVPEARGRGLGAAIAQFALVAAARGGAQRLVLAVDANNEVALAAYRRAGFHEWDRRIVYARLKAPIAPNVAS